jgi:hypothetical protein
MFPLIDHRHGGAKASGAVMVVMIRGALFVMRVARSVMIVVMLMLVRGGDKIAGVDRKASAVHADEHAENHNDLEKDSHVDALKIVGMVAGSSHFKASRP